MALVTLISPEAPPSSSSCASPVVTSPEPLYQPRHSFMSAIGFSATWKPHCTSARTSPWTIVAGPL
jgi:hypothetical protein